MAQKVRILEAFRSMGTVSDHTHRQEAGPPHPLGWLLGFAGLVTVASRPSRLVCSLDPDLVPQLASFVMVLLAIFTDSKIWILDL
jgi:hypothetical protein